MKIHVLYVVNGTTDNHWYTCVRATRQMGINGASIIFRDGPGLDEEGRKVVSAQYRQAETVITYED